MRGMLFTIKRKGVLRLLSLTILLLGLPLASQGTHLMGGELTYTRLANNRVAVQFVMYRDCSSSNNAGFDNSVTYRVYKDSAVKKSNYNFYSSYTVTRTSVSTIQPETPGCGTPSGVCIQRGIYSDTITIPNDSDTYHITLFKNSRNYGAIDNLSPDLAGPAWNRCTRNPFGSIWYATVPPTQYRNSTPQFITNPIPYICSGSINQFSVDAFDSDGDSLVYSFEVPYSPPRSCAGSGGVTGASPTPYPKGHSNFQTVNYATGYTYYRPFGTGSDTPTIDPLTGLITAKPSSTGQYVLAIAVNEYRRDSVTGKVIHLGEVRRDMQFIVGSCTTAPKFTYYPDTPYIRYYNVGDTIKIHPAAKAPLKNKLYLSGAGALFGNTTSFPKPYATLSPDSTTDSLYGTFTWTPNCDHVTKGAPHSVTLTVSDTTCNTRVASYSIYIKARPIQPAPRLKCVYPSGLNTALLQVDSTGPYTDFKAFNIYRRKNGVEWKLLKQLTTLNDFTYIDGSASRTDTNYYEYFVRTINACNISGPSSDTLSTIYLDYSFNAPPGEIDRARSLTFKWTAATPTNPRTYLLQQYKGGSWQTIISTTTRSYTIPACELEYDSVRVVTTNNYGCYTSSNKISDLKVGGGFRSNKPLIHNVVVDDQYNWNIRFATSDSSDVLQHRVVASTYGAFTSPINTLAAPFNDSETVTHSSVTSGTQPIWYVLANDSCGYEDTSYAFAPPWITDTTFNFPTLTLTFKNIIATDYKQEKLYVQRRIVGTGWITIDSIGSFASPYTVKATCDTQQEYRLLATDSIRFTPSNVISFIYIDTTPPAPPSVDVATVQGDDVSLSWTASTSTDVNRYLVLSKSGAGAWKLLAQIAADATTPTYRYVDFSTTPSDTAYTYAVLAIDSCAGNISDTSIFHTTISLQAVPGEREVFLNWNLYAGMTSPPQEVQRLSSLGWVTIATLSATETDYTDTSALCGQTFTYRIAAQGASDTAFSNEVDAQPFDTTAPLAPQIIGVNVTGAGDHELLYYPSASLDVDRLVITRSVAGGSWQSYDTIPAAGGPQLRKITIPNNVDASAYYSLLAIDSCGDNNSIFSDTSCSISLQASHQRCDQNTRLVWNAPKTPTAPTYIIQRTAVGGSPSPTEFSTDRTSYNDTTLLPLTRYNYRVSIVLNTGDTVSSTIASDSISYPGQPVLTHASVLITSSTNGSIQVNWRNSSQRPYLSHYRLWSAKEGSALSVLQNNIPLAQDSFIYSGINTSTAYYSFYVELIDSCGNVSLPSTTHTSALLSMSVGQLRHILNWHPYVDTGIRHYQIQELIGSSWIAVDTVSASDTSWERYPVSCSVPANYRIGTLTDEGDLAYSDTARGLAFDTIAPAAPIISHVRVLAGKIEVKWKAHPEEDVVEYYLARQSYNAPFTILDTLSYQKGKVYNYKDALSFPSLVPYNYLLLAVDSCGNASDSSLLHPNIQLAATPSNRSAQLSWTSYSGYPTSLSYTVQRFGTNGWTNIATGLTATKFTDTPLVCNQLLSYRILASNTKDTSISDSISVTPFDKIAPLAPSLRGVSALSNGSALLTLSGSPSADADRIIIYRQVASFWQAIDTVPNTTTTYTDAVVNTQVRSFCYYLVALDSCANNRSRASDTGCSIFLTAYHDSCRQEILLDWNPTGFNTSSGQHTEIFRGTTSPTLSIAKTSSNSYVDGIASTKTRFQYRVDVILNSGVKVSSAVATDSLYYPPQPILTHASVIETNGSTGKVQVNWRNDSLKSFLKKYRLYYSSGGSYTVLEDSIPTSATSYTHSSLNTSTDRHSYYVELVDRCGNVSPPSLKHTTSQLTMKIGQLTHDLDWLPYTGPALQYYLIQLETGSSYTTVDTVPANVNSWRLFPAPCNSLITYRVAAVTNENYLAYSDTASGQAIDAIPPDGVDFQLLTVAEDSLSLTYVGASSADIFGYDIKRATSQKGVYQTVHFEPHTTSFQNLSYRDSTNPSREQYCYTINTLDSCLNVTRSDTFCSINLKSTALNQAARLNWTTYQGFNGSTYILELLGSDTADYINSIARTFLDTPLTCDVPRSYRIRYEEGGGSRITYSNVTTVIPFDTIPPVAPELLLVSTLPDGDVVIEWTYDPQSDVKFYDIFRQSTNGSNTKIATVEKANAYVDGAANHAQGDFTYSITARDSCDLTRSSAASRAMPTFQLTTITGGCDPEITINWQLYAGWSAGTSNYGLYRSELGSNFQLLANLGAGDTTYVDEDKDTAITYIYRLAATDAASGRISFSVPDTIKPKVFELPPNADIQLVSVEKTGISDGTLRIIWNKADTDTLLRGYYLYRGTDSAGPYTEIYQTTDLADTTYTDTALNTAETRYFYYVNSFNTCNYQDSISTVHANTLLSVTAANLEMELLWSSYLGAGSDSVVIRRGENGKSVVPRYKLLPVLSYNDTQVRCDNIYTYRIETLLSNGLSSLSNAVSRTAFDTIPPATPALLYGTVLTTDLANGKVELYWPQAKEANRSGYIIYRRYGTDPYQATDTVLSVRSDTVVYITTANTYTDVLSYYITAIDSCGNEGVPSEAHTLTRLRATPVNSAVAVSWNNYQGYQVGGQILEKRVVGQSWRIIALLNANTTQYLDSAIKCDTIYEYRITTFNADSSLASLSSTDTAKGFETVLPKAPEFAYASVATTEATSGSVEVVWISSTAPDRAGYRIYRQLATGGPIELANALSNTPTTYTDFPLNTTVGPYRFWVVTIDSCGNETLLDSTPMQQTIYLEAKPRNEAILLDWTAYIGFNVERYEIWKDNQLLQTVDGSKLTYIDTLATCERYWMYRIIGFSNDGIPTHSNSVSAIPIDTTASSPPYLVVASVTEDADAVRLSWTKPKHDISYYELYKMPSKKFIGELIYKTSTSEDTAYLDNFDIPSDLSYCYRLRAYDYCGNVSDSSNFGCVLLAFVKKGDLENVVSWSRYQDYRTPVAKYRLLRKRDNFGWEEIAILNRDVFSYTDKSLDEEAEAYCYRVVAVQLGDLKAEAYSTVACARQAPRVYIPDAFTPNVSETLNDGFGPQGAYIANYHMQLYNRWGQKIYSTENGKPWNGKLGGVNAQSGMYTYVIQVEGTNLIRYHFKGTFYLLD